MARGSPTGRSASSSKRRPIEHGEPRDDAIAKLDAIVGADRADQVRAALASIMGLTDEPVPSEEIAWAVRRFVEVLATEPAGAGGRRPAGPSWCSSNYSITCWTSVVDRSCSSRSPRARGHPTRLAGLREPGAGTAGRACRNRRCDAAGSSGAGTASGGIALADPGVRRRQPAVRRTIRRLCHRRGARGPPTLDERTAVDLSIPPTIGALLAARLDRLPEAERHVLERPLSLGGRSGPEP